MDLGYKVKGRKVTRLEESYLIREPVASYNTLFEGKNMPSYFASLGILPKALLMEVSTPTHL
jgi:hypothetical protein